MPNLLWASTELKLNTDTSEQRISTPLYRHFTYQRGIMRTGTVFKENWFFFLWEVIRPKKKICPSQHVFFSNNSVMHLEWHMVSIFFRGLQFVFILHTNGHIHQRYNYPHILSLAKAESWGLGKSTRTGKACRDAPQDPSPAFRDQALCSKQKVMLLHWKSTPR